MEEKMSQKNSIWITYARNDNVDGDVDFIAQELSRAGLEVKLDRWNLTAGKHLWKQIDSFIQDPSKSDGWLLYATQASLGSQACKEEFAYALDRALHTRGGDFPVIALFPAPVDTNLIPAGIKTRLFVSVTDPGWKERIVAGVERRQPDIAKPQVEPYALKIYKSSRDGNNRYAIEVRPRGGTWVPFFAAIPLNEKDNVSPRLHHGPAKRNPLEAEVLGTFLSNGGSKRSNDGRLWIEFAGNEATPTQSYYILCKKLPSILIFGVDAGSPEYQVRF